MLSPASIVLIVAVGVFTLIAAISDLRTKRIPNALTFPMFFAGWIYQIIVSVFYGWGFLGDAALGFLVGFGILFVLWFVGGGGGGDVKLVGALSVWLGFKLTLAVLFLSTMIVLLATASILAYSLMTKGVRQTKSTYVGTGKTKPGQMPRPETVSEKTNRRVMAFAMPVAVASWLVLSWNLGQLHPAGVDHVPADVVSQPAEPVGDAT